MLRALQSCVPRSGDGLDVVEHVRRQMDPVRSQAVAALRAYPGRAEAPADAAFTPQSRPVESEDVLHGDDLPLHSGNLSDAGDLSRPVGEARYLDDQVDGRGRLLANRSLGDVEIRHGDHRIQAI